MGNSITNKTMIEPETCLICWENIGSHKWCKCVRCHIILHELCESTYRGEKDYCECPHCRRIGTIGSYK
jgi:hypothetical protein